MSQKDNYEARKWIGSVKGNLLKNIRTKIEEDSGAMYRVGAFLSSVGVSLLDANIFALELAKRIAYINMAKAKVSEKEGLEQHFEVYKN